MKELSGKLSLSLPYKIKTAFGKAGDVSVISRSAARPDGIPRSGWANLLHTAGQGFPPAAPACFKQSLVELGHCLLGRDIQSCFKNSKQFENLLPLPPALVSSSKG